MNRNALTAVVAVVAAFSVGFGWSYYNSTHSSGGVAIVDLSEVARRLGRDQEMVESIKGQATNLNQQLVNAEQSAKDQLGAMLKQIGETPTTEDSQKFANAKRSAQIQLVQFRKQAEARVGQHQQQLVAKFRDDAKPFVDKIAKERGITTVVVKNEAVVFSFDETVDITDEVVALMSVGQPVKAATQAIPATATPQAQPTPAAASAPTAEAPTPTATR